MPFALLFLLFIFLEIAGFVAMANSIGLLWVFVLIVAGMAAGGLVIRTIGLASVRRMQERADQGEPVGQELGGLVLGFLGGVLLIVPGFLTDMIGLALLIKPIQMLVWPRYGRQVADRMPNMPGEPWRSPGQRHGRGFETRRRTATVIIDADVETSAHDADAHNDAAKSTGGPDAPREPSSSGGSRDNPWGA